MRGRRAPPLALSLVIVVYSPLVIVTVALDMCQVGQKLTAATRDIDGSLGARCKTFVSEDCSMSCQWASSCRDSTGWHQYAGGNRSFVAGIRINSQHGLVLRCCVSLATSSTKCEWTDRSSMEQLASLPTTDFGFDPTTETIIRDVVINPYSPRVNVELRTEVCAVVRERSTCDIAKMVDEEIRSFRILLLRSSRSQLLRGTKFDRQHQVRLMSKLFNSATEFKEPPRTNANPYEAQITPQLRPVESINDLVDDGRSPAIPPLPQRPIVSLLLPQPQLPQSQLPQLQPHLPQSPPSPPSPPIRTVNRVRRPGLIDQRVSFETKTTRRNIFTTTARTATAPRISPNNAQCPRQPGWQPCVDKAEANRRVQPCCRTLSQGCQELCNYDINRDKLIGAALNGKCPVEELGGMIKCAAIGKDHTECCSAQGVFAEDGDLCKPLCNPQAGLTSVDYNFLPCLDHLDVIARCYWASIQP